MRLAVPDGGRVPACSDRHPGPCKSNIDHPATIGDQTRCRERNHSTPTPPTARKQGSTWAYKNRAEPVQKPPFRKKMVRIMGCCSGAPRRLKSHPFAAQLVVTWDVAEVWSSSSEARRDLYVAPTLVSGRIPRPAMAVESGREDVGGRPGGRSDRRGRRAGRAIAGRPSGVDSRGLDSHPVTVRTKRPRSAISMALVVGEREIRREERERKGFDQMAAKLGLGTDLLRNGQFGLWPLQCRSLDP